LRPFVIVFGRLQGHASSKAVGNADKRQRMLLVRPALAWIALFDTLPYVAAGDRAV
jgi:hypothetical protein